MKFLKFVKMHALQAESELEYSGTSNLVTTIYITHFSHHWLQSDIKDWKARNNCMFLNDDWDINKAYSIGEIWTTF